MKWRAKWEQRCRFGAERFGKHPERLLVTSASVSLQQGDFGMTDVHFRHVLAFLKDG